eukprot:SAG22_NODE_306_length_12671_cov_14.743239_15_plen_112_part_00
MSCRPLTVALCELPICVTVCLSVCSGTNAVFWVLKHFRLTRVGGRSQEEGKARWTARHCLSAALPLEIESKIVPLLAVCLCSQAAGRQELRLPVARRLAALLLWLPGAAGT